MSLIRNSSATLNRKYSVQISSSTNAEVLSNKMIKIADEEEIELLVYAVREDLIRRVMNEIQARHAEKQSFKYIVDCAHKALLQLLSVKFYVHDKKQQLFNSEYSIWTPDEELKSVQADSWAVVNVSILPSSLEKFKSPLEAAYDKIPDNQNVNSGTYNNVNLDENEQSYANPDKICTFYETERTDVSQQSTEAHASIATKSSSQSLKMSKDEQIMSIKDSKFISAIPAKVPLPLLSDRGNSSKMKYSIGASICPNLSKTFTDIDHSSFNIGTNSIQSVRVSTKFRVLEDEEGEKKRRNK